MHLTTFCPALRAGVGRVKHVSMRKVSASKRNTLACRSIRFSALVSSFTRRVKPETRAKKTDDLAG